MVQEDVSGPSARSCCLQQVPCSVFFNTHPSLPNSTASKQQFKKETRLEGRQIEQPLPILLAKQIARQMCFREPFHLHKLLTKLYHACINPTSLLQFQIFLRLSKKKKKKKRKSGKWEIVQETYRRQWRVHHSKNAP